MSDTVGIRRTMMGAGGAIADITSAEQHMSETIRQLMFNAPFTDIVANKYKLLDDSYRGTGGYEDGTYLVPHPREKEDKYLRRKQLAYYTNFVKPVVDAQVNPIFKQEPNRQNITSLYNVFINNVDGNDTTLTRFMKKAAIRAKLHGVEFIVMDMSEIADSSVVTKKDVIDKRLFPYLYLISPSNICDYAIDKFGRLIYIKYTVRNVIVDDVGNKKEVQETFAWTNVFCIKEVDGNTVKVPNPIGEIPIIPIYGAINNSDDFIPQSDVYAIARTNLALYNSTSELRERNRAQAFSILTYPLAEDDDYESGAESINVGVSDILMYRSGGESPAFITPPADPSNVILSEISFMIQQIYRMANMKDTQTISQYNVTGIAKEYDNQNLYQVILELAQGLQKAEYKIARIFASYTNENLGNISVVYNNEFGVVDTTSALNSAIQSLALNICPDFNLQLKKQVIRSVLTSVDTSLVEQIISNLEEQPTAKDPVVESEAKVVQPTRN